MGHNRRWRAISDADRYNADYLFRCRSCGREVVIERATFRAIAAAWGLGEDVETIARRSRCEVCGRRGNVFEMAAGGSAGALALHEGDELPPKGFSITRWLKMPNDQRRRHKRALRS